MSTYARRLPVLLIDGPISVYIYEGTNKEILEALGRLLPVIRIAALEIQKKLDDTQRGG